jgi:two-component system CheB/CheR fusion protein
MDLRVLIARFGQWFDEPPGHALRRYAGAMLAVALTLTARAAAGDADYAVLILLAGVIVSAWIGGIGPSLLAVTTLLVVHLNYYASEAETRWPPSAQSIANTSAFYAVGLTVAVLSRLVAAAQKRAQAKADEVLAEREQFRAILACMADAVVVADAQGRVALLNPIAEALLGIGLADGIERPLAEVLRLRDAQSQVPVADPAQQVMRERRIVHSEARLELRSLRGASTPIAFSAAPIRHDGGSLMGVVIVLRDETQRRNTEEALRSADRRKDEFLATLAHELRNPLAPICMGLEVMKLSSDDPTTMTDMRSMVERQTHHMVRLIDDLLDVSRITRGKLGLRKAPVELQAIVGHAVEASRPLLEEAGHTLSVDLPAEPVQLEADGDRLVQVFANLLNNSAKYTPPGGRISLVATATERQVAIAIRDTGHGIAPSRLPTIFEMFNQVGGASEHGHSGLGIGLTLVKSLVEMHGGTVEAVSAGLGHGSTFTVRLPRTEPHTTAHAQPARVAAGSPMPARRVLLVDDNRDSLVSTSVMVTALGHDVRTAADGVEAVEMAERFRPEIVLMDLGMPRMNGFDAARSIRSQPWGQAISLIAVTGWGQLNDRQRTDAAGFDGHLVKPLDLPALVQALATQPRHERRESATRERN